ncbi:MAG: acyl-CoA dehydrogenase family protein, partial [Sulfobacillus sp.]
MNWEWTPQMRQVRDFLHYFAQTEIRPISRAADIAHEVPLSFLTKVKALGISMEPIPASVGSAGGGEGVGEEEDSKRVRQTNRIAVVAAEEMAWGDAAVIITLPGPGLGGPPVAATGTAEQKTRLFGVFSAPEPKWGAYSLTEPE